MFKKILIFLILFVFISAKNTKYIDEFYVYNKLTSFNFIEIPKINLFTVFDIYSIKEEKIKNVTLFSEYGKPDIVNTNTILGGHSGNGINAYFKNLSNIKVGDQIVLHYKNKKYVYLVYDINSVHGSDISILYRDSTNSIVTLITCDIDDNYRLIITGKLIDNRDY